MVDLAWTGAKLRMMDAHKALAGATGDAWAPALLAYRAALAAASTLDRQGAALLDRKLGGIERPGGAMPPPLCPVRGRLPVKAGPPVILAATRQDAARDVVRAVRARRRGSIASY